MNVTLTKHAIWQYQQRVKPALRMGPAKRELEALLGFAELRAEMDWHALGENEDPPDAYLLISDGIALPLAQEDGAWVALTCLTRSGCSQKERAYKNAKRARRRRSVRDRARKGIKRKRLSGRMAKP